MSARVEEKRHPSLGMPAGSGSWWTSRQNQKALRTGLQYLFVLAGGVVFLIPFLWMVSSALKASDQLYAKTIEWIPNPVRWQNFGDALTTLPFGLYFRNTALITLTTLVGSVLSASLVAYGFARLRFPGRDILFVVLLATMMLPPQVTLIPTFLLYNKIGWYNTFLPLIVPGFLGGGPFLIFLVRQFILSIPLEIDEAAKIDGCGPLSIWWRIILPNSKPALTTIAIFSFVYSWNDFMGPLIYLLDPDKMTVALALQLFKSQYTTDIGLLMAASIVAVIPVVALFFVAQKYFIQGIVVTGVKG